jgi:hypothetical protein
MEFKIAPEVLHKGLTKLLPNARKRSLLKQGPSVTLIAAGERIQLLGDFENSFELPAQVLRQGVCRVDLMSLILLLGNYPRGKFLTVTLERGALRFGTTTIRVKHDPA